MVDNVRHLVDCRAQAMFGESINEGAHQASRYSTYKSETPAITYSLPSHIQTEHEFRDNGLVPSATSNFFHTPRI